MATETSPGHRLIRRALIRHLTAKRVPATEQAVMFRITPTYVRRIATDPDLTDRTAEERAIREVAGKYRGYLVRRGLGFFFR